MKIAIVALTLLAFNANAKTLNYKNYKELFEKRSENGTTFYKANCVDINIKKTEEGFEKSKRKSVIFTKVTVANNGYYVIMEDKTKSEGTDCYNKGFTTTKYEFLDDNTRKENRTTIYTYIDFNGDIQTQDFKRERIRKMVDGIVEVVSTTDTNGTKEGDDWLCAGSDVKGTYVSFYRKVKNLNEETKRFENFCTEVEITEEEFNKVK